MNLKAPGIRLLLMLSLLTALSGVRCTAQQPIGTKHVTQTTPVFKVHAAYPTSDKPQSKLWFMGNSWWAILPSGPGPSLWQRTAKGWFEHAEIAKALEGIPGRVDVWADTVQVTAVGVSPHSLTVFRLTQKINHGKIRWTHEILAVLHPPLPDDEIETATIVRDQRGRFWVASDAGDKICVWNSGQNATIWTGPQVLATQISKDDISCITVLQDSRIGVIWSDQASDKVSIRIHHDAEEPGNWDEEQIVQAGNKTADDHLHASLSPNGTLWVATKNSVDELGSPQFVMRVLSKNGKWRNLPYAPLGQVRAPSRPVVIATENPDVILAGHTIYNTKNPALGEIVFGLVDTTNSSFLRNEMTVIRPDTAGWRKGNRINDITVPKRPFPKNVPWVILASDQEGHVYEADLKALLKNH